MTAPEFQKLLDNDPFVPFTLTFNGGWTCTIDDPTRAWVTQHGSGEVRYPNGGGAIMSLDHVVTIDFITPTAIVS